MRRKRLEEDKKEAIKKESDFRKLKGRFFGIVFSDGLIDVKVLESVVEYIQESDALKHCVFQGEYYSKPNTLVLSARINGKPIETIEVSLKDYSILQCRGKRNGSTEYHDRIISLVSENISLIRSRNSNKRIGNKLTEKAV